MDLSSHKKIIESRVEKAKQSSRPTTQWQEFGKEIGAYFNIKNAYWVLCKYPEFVVRYAFSVMRERGMHSFPYFLGIVKSEYQRVCSQSESKDKSSKTSSSM